MKRANKLTTMAAALPLFLVLVSACGSDGERARAVDWTKTPPISGNVIGGRAIVESPGEALLPLVVIDKPGIGGTGYVVSGEVSYEGVGGRGFLEMWSVFADGKAYFSRTLGSAGPMAALSGSSGPRRFELPFYLEGAPAPDRLEVNLVLPAGGRVSIGPLTLRALDSNGSDAWWTDSSGAWIGGLAGSVLGVIGALTGVLAGLRRGRRLVVTAIPVVVTLGLAAFAAGALAAALGQPRAVFYPLMLAGALAVAVFGLIRVPVKRAYQDDELRRMRALDV